MSITTIAPSCKTEMLADDSTGEFGTLVFGKEELLVFVQRQISKCRVIIMIGIRKSDEKTAAEGSLCYAVEVGFESEGIDPEDRVSSGKKQSH